MQQTNYKGMKANNFYKMEFVVRYGECDAAKSNELSQLFTEFAEDNNIEIALGMTYKINESNK